MQLLHRAYCTIIIAWLLHNSLAQKANRDSSRLKFTLSHLTEIRNVLKAKDGSFNIPEAASCPEAKGVKEENKQMSHPDVCPNFEPIQNSNKTISCFLAKRFLHTLNRTSSLIDFYSTKRDLDNGITVEGVVASKLCTHVYLMMPFKYTNKGMDLIQLHGFDEQSLEKWTGLGVKLMARLGGWMNDTILTSPSEISRTFSMNGHRTNLVSSIANLLVTGKNYHGFLLSWYFPGCPADDCKIGPMADENRMNDFFKSLREKLTEKNHKAVVALEVNIKKDNLYMGYGLYALSTLIDIMLFQNSASDQRLQEFIELQSGNREPKGQDYYHMKAQLINTENGIVLNNNTHGFNCTYAIKNSTLLYHYDEIGSLIKKVEAYLAFKQIGGVWIRDLWADDTKNECGCGSFPILKAANIGIKRGFFQMQESCPTPRK